MQKILAAVLAVVATKRRGAFSGRGGTTPVSVMICCVRRSVPFLQPHDRSKVFGAGGSGVIVWLVGWLAFLLSTPEDMIFCFLRCYFMVVRGGCDAGKRERIRRRNRSRSALLKIKKILQDFVAVFNACYSTRVPEIELKISCLYERDLRDRTCAKTFAGVKPAYNIIYNTTRYGHSCGRVHSL